MLTIPLDTPDLIGEQSQAYLLQITAVFETAEVEHAHHQVTSGKDHDPYGQEARHEPISDGPKRVFPVGKERTTDQKHQSQDDNQ